MCVEGGGYSALKAKLEALVGMRKSLWLPCRAGTKEDCGGQGRRRNPGVSGLLLPLDPGCLCPPRQLQRLNPQSELWAGGGSKARLAASKASSFLA